MSLLILAKNTAFRETAVREARRSFLGKSSLLLSGAAVALLSGRDALAKVSKSTESDVRILNSALGAELEAIAAYQVGAESGLLQKPVLDLAVTFQGHHKEHADVLAKTVARLGGKPVSAKAKYTFPTEKLKSQADVLRFAAALEKGAVSAYLGAVAGGVRVRGAGDWGWRRGRSARGRSHLRALRRVPLPRARSGGPAALRAFRPPRGLRRGIRILGGDEKIQGGLDRGSARPLS